MLFMWSQIWLGILYYYFPNLSTLFCLHVSPIHCFSGSSHVWTSDTSSWPQVIVWVGHLIQTKSIDSFLGKAGLAARVHRSGCCLEWRRAHQRGKFWWWPSSTMKTGKQKKEADAERWKEDFQGSLKCSNSCFLPFLKLGCLTTLEFLKIPQNSYNAHFLCLSWFKWISIPCNQKIS